MPENPARGPDRLRYRLTVDACPQAALRVLGLFAQRALLPDVRLENRARSGLLIVELALGRAEGEILLHKLRAIPAVRTAGMQRLRS